jgi:hypothetical protein
VHWIAADSMELISLFEYDKSQKRAVNIILLYWRANEKEKIVKIKIIEFAKIY